MSQSDYLKYKKISTELKSLSKMDSILDTNQYTDYKNYSLENKIQNTKISYDKLIPTGKIMILNMEKKVTNCPTFPTCTNTVNRLNRKTHPQIAVNPLRPLYQKKNRKCDCTMVFK